MQSFPGTRGSIWLSIKYYLVAAIDTFGPFILLIAGVAMLKFLFHRKDIAGRIASLSLLSPLVFYAVSFYTGQVVIMVPGVSNLIFNARFGTEAALPAAFFIATFIDGIPKVPAYFSRIVAPVLLCVLVILQSFLVLRGGIVSLQDGQYGLSCMPNTSVNTYLAQHYNGGMILEDTYLGSPNEGPQVGIPLHNIIKQGSEPYWRDALNNPGATVGWVIIGLRTSQSTYPIQVNTSSPLFQRQFTRVVNDAKNGYQLYQHTGIPVPAKTIPDTLKTSNLYCRTGKRP